LAIDYQKRDGVAYITLNNPAKANILDKATSDEISQAWIDLWEDRAIRCAILTGAGDRHFCGGHNLAPRKNITPEEREYLRTQRIFWPLAGTVHGQKTGVDLWMFPLSGDRKPVPLLQSAFNEMHGQISPDGKWLAYFSNETGRSEVYVQPFPQGTSKWQVSTNGGQYPRWRHDGRELFYMSRASGGKMMAVDVKSAGSAFETGTPQELFEPAYVNLPHGSGGPYHTYAVSPDGQRFLIPRPPSNDQQTTATPIVVVLNWLEGLKK